MKNAISLNAIICATVNNGNLTIFEAQQEFEGENGACAAVVPAKSIWINSTPAVLLRDFLNKQYPLDKYPVKEE